MIAHDSHPTGSRIQGQDMAFVQRTLAAAARLLLFRNVLAAEAGQALLALLDVLDREPVGHAGAVAVAAAYGRLFSALATAVGPAHAWPDAAADELPAMLVPHGEENAWLAYVVGRTLRDENPFTRAAQVMDAAEIAPALRQAAAHDLRLLHELAHLDGPALAAAVARACGDGADPVAWTRLRRPAQRTGSEDSTRGGQESHVAMAARLAASADWAACVDELAAHVARHGSGPLAGHSALRWTRTPPREGRLTPVLAPDPISPADLFSYQEQRRALADNTERFLAGLPAHDVLLFGARGTGKSSSVKALLAAYAGQGLRLVEVPRDALVDLAAVCAALRGRAGRYIIFVDDLSFEEQETGYKDLKAVLEGRLEARPANVHVYATSNRRHLVRERFGDRARPGAETEAEVRAGDTAQEKLSLADRFGLVLVYTTPDQERYLEIVEGIARRRGLTMPDEELRARALRWAEWNNGRSGRTARQFVDGLISTRNRGM